MGCRPIWDQRPAGYRHRGTAHRGHGPRARRCHLAHFRIVPRSLSGADRAARRRSASGRRARRRPRRKSARRGAARERRSRLERIFGTAPGAYGSASKTCSAARPILRRSAPHISPPPRMLMAAPAAKAPTRERFRAARRRADLLVHPSDDPRAIFWKAPKTSPLSAALPSAAKMLGRAVDLIMLDVTDPQRPRARTLSAALARIVRGRAINPRFIAGQMRHGPRGAAELAEQSTVWSPSRRRPAPWRANFSISCTRPMSPTRRARLSAARKSASRRRDCGAARRRAPARLLAPAAQRHRATLAALRAEVRRDRPEPSRLAPRRLSRIVGADADRRRIAGAADADRPPLRLMLPDVVRSRARTATASSRSPRAAAFRCGG